MLFHPDFLQATRVLDLTIKLFIYGGVGNMSGEEHIGRKYFDDLYEVDLR